MAEEGDEARETELAIARCLAEGSVWVNSVFRFQNKPIRVFKRRFTPLEIFWALASAVVTALVLVGLSLVFGSGGPFFILFSPVAIVFWSLVALVMGRRIAFMSPLRRHTGEGTGTWMVLMFRRIVSRISFTFSRPVMYNYCDSRAGEPNLQTQRVECIEWLGSAHSPRAPFRPEEGGMEPAEVTLVPRGRAIYNHKRNGVKW